jgi:hypothetical protein
VLALARSRRDVVGIPIFFDCFVDEGLWNGVGHAWFQRFGGGEERLIAVRSFRERHYVREVELSRRHNSEEWSGSVETLRQVLAGHASEQRIYAVGLEVLDCLSGGGPLPSGRVLARRAGVAQPLIRGYLRTLPRLAPALFQRLANRREADLAQAFAVRAEEWSAEVAELDDCGYDDAEYAVALELRVLRFSVPRQKIPGVSELAALANVSESLVPGLITRLRNHETLRALELAFTEADGDWSDEFARLLVDFSGAELDVAGGLVLGRLRGEAVCDRFIADVTGIPFGTVARHRRKAWAAVGEMIAEVPAPRGPGRPRP